MCQLLNKIDFTVAINILTRKELEEKERHNFGVLTCLSVSINNTEILVSKNHFLLKEARAPLRYGLIFEGQRKYKVNQKAKKYSNKMRPYKKDSGACLKVGPMDKFGAT